jgi:hypothetical protein
LGEVLPAAADDEASVTAGAMNIVPRWAACY